MRNLFDQVPTIHLVDVGCIGALHAKWSELYPVLSYTGFDPNSDECRRLREQPHPYRQCEYLPFAVAGAKGNRTLYKTKDAHCYSLLQPNHQWLARFEYFDSFSETGTESVECRTLDDAARQNGLEADILKIDSQGLDLEILQSAHLVLEGAFCVESEPGFQQNYLGENLYAQVDDFLRARGFLLFDIKVYRVARNNAFAQSGKHQPLWSETTWLFDVIGRERKVTRDQAIKYLMICKALKYYDYGLELADYFGETGVLQTDEVAALRRPEAWRGGRESSPHLSKTARLLKLFPEAIQRRLLKALSEISELC